VNCTLETADGMLVWVHRTGRSAIEGGSLAVAMSEGVSSVDVDDDGSWSPNWTALRGFKEELGIEPAELLEIELHSLIAQVANGGLSVIGHARTTLTADEVRDRHLDALDADEADGPLVMTEGTVEAVAQLLMTSAPRNWVSWAPAAVLGYLASRHGDVEHLVPRIRRGTSAPSGLAVPVAG
jgi:hypothetical protein